MKGIINFSLLVFLVVLGILLPGCTKSFAPGIEKGKLEDNSGLKSKTEQANVKKNEKLTPGDFFPISTGHSWEYQGEGNEYASFTRNVIGVKNSLSQIREDNGGTVSASVFRSTKEAITHIFFIGEAYDETNYLDSKPNQNIVILKAPLKIGTKWYNTNEVREIVDINVNISTPAGIFQKCVKVKISAKNSIVNEYFKEGIGMVKREFISGDAIITSSLAKYK